MKTENVKGFNDFTGKESEKRAEAKKIISEVFESYGFNVVETPTIEYEEFVKGNNSQASDEVISDIFKLQDKGKRKLALRYEFTFQLKRLMKNKKLPYKRYQIGSVFRDEPVSANRFREFVQCDADIIGLSNNPARDEAEVLALASEITNKLGIKAVININNRILLNEILDSLKIKNKEQVMREIDKLDKLSEKQVKENLKKYKAEKLLQIFKKSESYFRKYNSYKLIEELKKNSRAYGVRVNFQPSLSRGLAYYDGMIFEIKTQKLKESICGGGSYTFNNLKGTGISFGLERISGLANLKIEKEKILVISLNQDKQARKLTQKLRKQGKSVGLFYGKPSKALEYANSYNIGKVIFVGKEEIKKKKFKVKDMKSGRENFEMI